MARLAVFDEPRAGEARSAQPALPAERLADFTQGITPAALEANGDPRRVAEPGGRAISGRVLDASGGEIAGAVLQARGSDGRTLGAALSTGDGRFSLSVTSTTVELSASADGYSTDSRHIDAPHAGLMLSLTPVSAVEGRVEAFEAGEQHARIRLDTETPSARAEQQELAERR